LSLRMRMSQGHKSCHDGHVLQKPRRPRGSLTTENNTKKHRMHH
jgi:hypothetical protein